MCDTGQVQKYILIYENRKSKSKLKYIWEWTKFVAHISIQKEILKDVLYAGKKKQPRSNRTTELPSGESDISQTYLWSFQSSTENYYLWIAECSLSCLHIWICYPSDLECLFLPFYLPNSYSSFTKIRSPSSVKYSFFKKK